MSRDLTVLCITRGDDYAQRFVARLAQDTDLVGARLRVETDGAGITSAGYIESILDEAVAQCDTDYILRIDDDETLSLALLEWLRAGKYRAADHWAFVRRNLWPTAGSYITNRPLYPDLQTRLSVKAKSGGRPGVHQGSPYGTGRLAPEGCAIDHHKFVARGRAEREALVRHYDQISPGVGETHIMFSLPELYADDLVVEAIA